MSLQSVIILADRLDRGRALADATQAISPYRITDTSEMWPDIEEVQGVIADVSLAQPATRQCLKNLSDRLSGRSMPLVYLMRAGHRTELQDARRHGATACLNALTEPREVVSGLFRQIYPNKTITELFVQYSFYRSVRLFEDIFADTHVDKKIDLTLFDREIDPILTVIEQKSIKLWLDLISSHDDMTVRHCLLVAILAANIAVYLKLPSSDRTTLVRAALIHDVGKTQIPVSILNNPGPLTTDEISVMRTHATLGYDMLISSGMTDPVVLNVARNHHEMLDGSGYPDALRGAQISDMVRLLTICDIYAALTENRPYRAAMSQEKALSTLHEMTPNRLELSLVKVFSESLTNT